MREKRKGYPKIVKIGGQKDKKTKKGIALIKNIHDLNKITSKRIILGKVGKKKKIEIVKKADEKKIEIVNLNITKFLKKAELKEKNKKSEDKKWT